MDMLKEMEIIYGYNLQKIIDSSSMRELHKEFSCTVFNEKDTYEFFKKFQIEKNDIEGISVPTLILQSQDDPICHYNLVMKDDIRKNPNLFYAETKIGGHVCWFDGNLGPVIPVSDFFGLKSLVV